MVFSMITWTNTTLHNCGLSGQAYLKCTDLDQFALLRFASEGGVMCDCDAS